MVLETGVTDKAMKFIGQRRNPQIITSPIGLLQFFCLGAQKPGGSAVFLCVFSTESDNGTVIQSSFQSNQ